MAPKLTADAAYFLSQTNVAPLHRRAVRDNIRSLEKDIRRRISYAGTDVCVNSGGGNLDAVGREAVAHFEARGFWLRGDKGICQGGGTCIYWYLCWGPKPVPVATRVASWWSRFFGDGCRKEEFDSSLLGRIKDDPRINPRA